MERYEIKGVDRYKVYMWIASASVILYLLINYLTTDIEDELFNIILSILSIGGFSIVSFHIYDKFLWKLKLFYNIPNLNGIYKGTIQSSFGRNFNCKITIYQTFTKLLVKLETDKSCSFNTNGFIDITKGGIYKVSYEYQNRKNGQAVKTMNDHSGYATIEFSSDESGKMIGRASYFNDIKNRDSYGEIYDIECKSRKSMTNGQEQEKNQVKDFWQLLFF